MRTRLPERHASVTRKVKIAGHTLFITVGSDESGPKEVFVDCSRHGTLIRGMLSSFAMSLSIGLQYGIPLQEYLDAFAGMQFEPCGAVETSNGHKEISEAESPVDLIVRILAIEAGRINAEIISEEKL